MPSSINKIFRVIDANFNRAKEGLRVCEEVCRFIIDDKKLTQEAKILRHKITSLAQKFCSMDLRINSRLSKLDIGQKIYAQELFRNSISDIFFANIQRVKESVRVLEEFSKLKNKNFAKDFKFVRYQLYDFEKKALKKCASLSNIR